MTNKTSSFIFRGREVSGVPRRLFSGAFLQAGENLLLTGSHGLNMLELSEIICKNAGKTTWRIRGSHPFISIPLDHYPNDKIDAAEVLVILDVPDYRLEGDLMTLVVALNKILVRRNLLKLPTIVIATGYAKDHRWLKEMFPEVARGKWHNAIIFPTWQD